MKFAFGTHVSSVCFFGCVKPSKERAYSVCAYPRSPTFAAFHLRHSKQTARFVPRMGSFLVLNVTCSRHISKIVKRVISWVSVNVVNVAGRPIFGHVVPRQPASAVPYFVDPNDCVPLGFCVPSNRPQNNFSASLYLPSKNSGFRAVVQQCVQFSMCDVNARHAVSLT